MAVILGSITLDHVLSWDEQATMTIPRKKVIRKTTPTTQSEYWCRTPREIILRARVTSVTKEALHTLRNAHAWQDLYDYDGVTKVDDVWLESVRPSWKGDEDEDYPWLVELNLVCSST